MDIKTVGKAWWCPSCPHFYGSCCCNLSRPSWTLGSRRKTIQEWKSHSLWNSISAWMRAIFCCSRFHTRYCRPSVCHNNPIHIQVQHPHRCRNPRWKSTVSHKHFCHRPPMASEKRSDCWYRLNYSRSRGYTCVHNSISCIWWPCYNRKVAIQRSSGNMVQRKTYGCLQ